MNFSKLVINEHPAVGRFDMPVDLVFRPARQVVTQGSRKAETIDSSLQVQIAGFTAWSPLPDWWPIELQGDSEIRIRAESADLRLDPRKEGLRAGALLGMVVSVDGQQLGFGTRKAVPAAKPAKVA